MPCRRLLTPPARRAASCGAADFAARGGRAPTTPGSRAATATSSGGSAAAALPIERFDCPPEEVIVQEASRRQRGHFNLIAHDTGFKADVYLANEDPLHGAALERRRRVMLGEEPVWVAPPEYVILRRGGRGPADRVAAVRNFRHEDDGAWDLTFDGLSDDLAVLDAVPLRTQAARSMASSAP